MKTSDNCLIVFLKNLELGKVKTRLAKDVGNEKALAIYSKLSEHTLTVASNSNVHPRIYFSNKIEWPYNIDAKHFATLVQKGNDLGERIRNAFEESFLLHHKVCIIGSDCPEISSELIQEAFNKLDEVDLVIGPAKDGGYYLLGMNTPFKNLFDGIEWSTSSVLTHTKSKAKDLNLKLALLKTLSDVDTKEDLSSLSSFI